MFRATSCAYGATRCRNSVENAGESRSKCPFCRLAPDAEGTESQYWIPVAGLTVRERKHPVIEQLKRLASLNRSRQAHQARLQRDKGKKRIVRKATRAEAQTEKQIIAATRNSGRSNRDGDHVAAGQITLDTKLQSTRDNPVVLLEELAKVREDAARAGNPIGGLVLKNKHGVGVVVFALEDFASTILSRL